MTLHTFLRRAAHAALLVTVAAAVAAICFILGSDQLTGLLVGVRLAALALIAPVAAAALWTGSAWVKPLAWTR